MKNKKINIADSWDKNAKSWVKQLDPIFKKKDLLWGTFGPWESDVRLISPVKNKRVLVLGCGSGPDVWWLARNGAKVIGVDISKNQLSLAKELMAKNGLKAEFIQMDLDQLSPIHLKNKFDIAISNYALQYAKDHARLFPVVAKVLQKNGKFVFSMDHPISNALIEKKVNFDINYHKERTLYWSFAADKKRVPAYSFHTKMSSTLNALVKAGFVIDKVLEPEPQKELGVGNSRGYQLAKRIPETIIISAHKG